jgi:hypothetical protein
MSASIFKIQNIPTMKNYIFVAILLCLSLNLIAQGYIEVKDEPFRRADMIIIQSDSITKDAFDVIAMELVKHGFVLDKLLPKYGILTTELRERRIVQLKFTVIIDNQEIKISGSYNSLVPMGMQVLAGVGNSNGSNDSKSMILDYRNDLAIYYEEMIEIAQAVKDKINAKKIFHVERGLTCKFNFGGD